MTINTLNLLPAMNSDPAHSYRAEVRGISDEIDPLRQRLGSVLLSGNVEIERNLEGIVSEETELMLRDAWNRPNPYAQTEEEKAIDASYISERIAGSINNIRELHEYTGFSQDEIERFISTFGITQFYRYDPIKLYDQLLTWDSGQLSGVDTLMIVGRDGDHDNAFKNVAEPFYSPAVENGTNVFVFETPAGVNNIEAVMKKVDNRNETSESITRLTSIVLGAHGVVTKNEDGSIDVGLDDLGIDKTTDLRMLAKSIDKIGFTGNPAIILNSCLTGKEIDGEASLAQSISVGVPKSTVIAPDQVIFDVVKSEDGRLSFTNVNSAGDTAYYNVDSGRENRMLKGTLLKARTLVYQNGKRISKDVQGHTITPAGVRANFRTK